MRWRDWVEAVADGLGHVELRVRSVLADEDESPTKDVDHTDDDPGPDSVCCWSLVPVEEDPY